MVIKHDFANVQVAHSDIFWFGLYTPTFSPDYRNYQNTTHLQEKQHSSGQIKASCQSQVHSFPREEGIKFESSEVCITFWQRHILSSWFSSFNPPYLYRPGQNLNQSVWASPHYTFISQPLTQASNTDLLGVPLTSRPRFPKWHMSARER